MEKRRKWVDGYYDRVRHTLKRCVGVLHTESDTELLGLVYEDLAVDVLCDWCDANLEALLEENYIYPEITERITKLREKMTELMRLQKSAAEIRESEAWRSAAEEAMNVLEMLYI